MIDEYHRFLESKRHSDELHGFKPLWMPDFLFDFQAHLTEWAIRKGRAALFADTGLGKTPMQLVWAENVVRKTGGNVLIITPLAVSPQTVREGEKFGVECKQSKLGRIDCRIVVTNYERLHYFKPSDFSGVVCDESGAIKHFESKRQEIVTEFLRKMPYRLLCTATPSPNDYIELGTSSEALGQMGRMDMLATFFKNDEDSLHPIWIGSKWRIKRHSERAFWRWVCSWARAVRKPSDMGCEDNGFVLPPLSIDQVTVEGMHWKDGFGLRLAKTLDEQRAERRITIEERCKRAAEVAVRQTPSVAWCHLNAEGDLLESLIPNAVQVSGSDSDEVKEDRFLAFVDGKIPTLVTKPRIACFGLNWQHCSNMSFFPSHSFEQWYQAVRRCWRFGQRNPVRVTIVTSPGEAGVLKNLRRKAKAADEMLTNLVREMNDELKLSRSDVSAVKAKMPSWLSRPLKGKNVTEEDYFDFGGEDENCGIVDDLRGSGTTKKADVGISRSGWKVWNSSGKRGKTRRFRK